MTQKKCSSCKTLKPLEEFNRNRSNLDSLHRNCRDCQATMNLRKLQDESKPLNGKLCPVDDTPIRGNSNRKFCSLTCKHKVKRYRQEYGLDIADFRRMVDATGGVCPLCQEKPSNWSVDHNHETGEVTGVVCNPCNIGSLAHSRHDVARVRRLLAYLEQTPAQQLGIDARTPEGFTRKSNIHAMWGKKDESQ